MLFSGYFAVNLEVRVKNLYLEISMSQLPTNSYVGIPLTL